MAALTVIAILIADIILFLIAVGLFIALLFFKGFRNFLKEERQYEQVVLQAIPCNRAELGKELSPEIRRNLASLNWQGLGALCQFIQSCPCFSRILSSFVGEAMLIKTIKREEK